MYMQTPPNTVEGWFEIFDFTRTGAVSIREVESIMRLMLLKVEQSVLYPIVTAVNPNGMYTLPDLLSIHEQVEMTVQFPSAMQLVNSLRQYPGELEVITKCDLEHIHRTLIGEQFSELQLDWPSSLPASEVAPRIAAQLVSIGLPR
jgi:hypothetical protein